MRGFVIDLKVSDIEYKYKNRGLASSWDCLLINLGIEEIELFIECVCWYADVDTWLDWAV